MKQKFQIYISGNRIFSNAQKAFQLQQSKNLGEKLTGKITYSPFEAFYLVETKKANIINLNSNKILKEEKLISIFSKNNKEFLDNYNVFKKLESKGFRVKTGSKFGAEFRVYSSPKNLNDFSDNHHHAKWLVFPVSSKKLDIKEFISKSRIAHSTAKRLLLAIIDNEDILFYEIDWKKI